MAPAVVVAVQGGRGHRVVVETVVHHCHSPTRYRHLLAAVLLLTSVARRPFRMQPGRRNRMVTSEAVEAAERVDGENGPVSVRRCRS